MAGGLRPRRCGQISFNTALGQLPAEQIAFGRPIVDQAVRQPNRSEKFPLGNDTKPVITSPAVTATIEAIRASELPDAEKAKMFFRLLIIENRRRELELPGELTKYGLNGTLGGAIGSLILLLLLATMSLFAPKDSITGTHLCILAGILCATVVFYGAFVFDRSVNIAAAWKDGFSAGTAKPPATSLTRASQPADQ